MRLLEQLTFFSNASIVLEDVDTLRSPVRHLMKAQIVARKRWHGARNYKHRNARSTCGRLKAWFIVLTPTSPRPVLPLSCSRCLPPSFSCHNDISLTSLVVALILATPALAISSVVTLSVLSTFSHLLFLANLVQPSPLPKSDPTT